MIDGRTTDTDVLTNNVIRQLCDRHFGIGADGLIILSNSNTSDFYMKYYNADGNESTLCGNGGRCTTLFAKHLGIINTEAHFEAIDGIHTSHIREEWIDLKMNDVQKPQVFEDGYFLNTGSPHWVIEVSNLQEYKVVEQGRKRRNHPHFAPKGTNVNFVEWIDNELHIRTYERGVENETLSCGTGVTAAAIVAHFKNNPIKGRANFKVHTQGGVLQVRFEYSEVIYHNVWLSGPAKHVFSGTIDV